MAPAQRQIFEMPRQGPPGDLGDILDTRRNLMGIVRGGGTEGTAALRAVEAIDQHLDPRLVTTVKDLDKNYAIAQRAKEVERIMTDAKAAAASSRYVPREGTQLRRAAAPFLKQETKFVSPEVQAAAREAATAGPLGRSLQLLSIPDPSRGYLNVLANLTAAPFSLAHPMTAITQAGVAGAGYLSGKAYDALMRYRAAQLSNAIRNEAPLSMAQPGWRPISLPPSRFGTLAPAAVPLVENYWQ
jgi:hypothetical protein